MKVKFVSITYPEIEGIVTPEDLIVYCARVSNPNNQLNTETGDKLIKYCIEHKHWSIFDMVDMTVEIKTSRAIAAQIIRHKSFCFQEFSQRYASIQTFEPVELRKQGVTNRQVGDEVFNPEIDTETVNCGITGDYERPVDASDAINAFLKDSKNLYNKLISKGVAKECARMILPLTTQTTLYMKGSCRSWIHYLQLRLKQDTQKEHRLVAEKINKIFIEKFPIVSTALNNME